MIALTMTRRRISSPNGMVSVIRKDAAEVDDPPKPPAAG
jgi:hypothetical protein